MIYIAVTMTEKGMPPHIQARVYDGTLGTYFAIDFYSYEKDLNPLSLAALNGSTLWFRSTANYEDIKKAYIELGYLDGSNYALCGKNCADAVRDTLIRCGFDLPEASSGWTSICCCIPFFACCCRTPESIYDVLSETETSSHDDISATKLKHQPSMPKTVRIDPEMTYEPAATATTSAAGVYHRF